MKICGSEFRNNLIVQAKSQLQFVEDNNISIKFCVDDNYPHRLSNCDDAPVCLYSIGNCNLDATHIVAIVGTRNATTYGIEVTRRLVHELHEKLDDVLIISGLAYGIDVAAHRASLSDQVPTVGVVAHGLDTLYPAEHRDVAARMVRSGGGLVTEYVAGARIHRANFLARNRIVAGLCDALVVVESDYKGGALATARIASLYGRTVFAVPGRVNDMYSRGTNRLIDNDTARILIDADSLIANMGWTPKAKDTAAGSPYPVQDHSPEHQELLDFIIEHPEATVNDICATLGLPFPKVQDRLFQMEMNDLIVSVPGGRFAKI